MLLANLFPIIVTQLLVHCPSAIVKSSALENKFILWCDFLMWFRLSISMTRFRFYNSTYLADVICRVIFCLWNIILCSVFTFPLFAFLHGFITKVPLSYRAPGIPSGRDISQVQRIFIFCFYAQTYTIYEIRHYSIQQKHVPHLLVANFPCNMCCFQLQCIVTYTYIFLY